MPDQTTPKQSDDVTERNGDGDGENFGDTKVTGPSKGADDEVGLSHAPTGA